MQTQVTANGNYAVFNIPLENSGIVKNTGVSVTMTPVVSAASGLTLISYVPSQGTFDPLTGVWNVGDMDPNTKVYLKITYRVDDISNAGAITIETVAYSGWAFALNATGTLTETDLTDNALDLYITAGTECPTGSALPAFGCGGCIDLANYTTTCNQGTTEWRINAGVINGTVNLQEESKLKYTYTDPTQPITGTYDLYCVSGVVDTLVVQGVPFTIYPLITDKVPFDHKISSVAYADLTVAELVILQAQYVGVDLSGYCWQVIRNGDGVLTSGIGMDCGYTTKYTIESLNTPFDALLPLTGVTIPATTTAGDYHSVLFDDGIAYYASNGTTFVFEKFFPDATANPFPTAISIADHPTLTGQYIIELTLSDGAVVDAPFDISWTRLADIPAGFADDIDDEGIGAITVDWADILNKPAGFADDIDDNTSVYNSLTLEIVNGFVRLLDGGVLVADAALPASAGLTEVFSDATITGDGSAGDPLSVVATTATVSTDATLTGDGSVGDPLIVANEFTAADEVKLDGIEALAQVNVPHADHTGEVTSIADGAQTITPLAISNKVEVVAADSDYIMILDATDGNLKKVTVNSINLQKEEFGSHVTLSYKGGIDNLGTTLLFFPKGPSQALDSISAISVFGSSIASDLNIVISKLDGSGSIGAMTYNSGEGYKTASLGDVFSEGYVVRIINTSAIPDTDSQISVTLSYS